MDAMTMPFAVKDDKALKEMEPGDQITGTLVVTQDGGVWLESPDGSRETAMALQSALKSLPDEQREVVVLKIWGQLTFEEAAAVIGISPNTAASRYRYGIEKLKDIWK